MVEHRAVDSQRGEFESVALGVDANVVVLRGEKNSVGAAMLTAVERCARAAGDEVALPAVVAAFVDVVVTGDDEIDVVAAKESVEAGSAKVSVLTVRP